MHYFLLTVTILFFTACGDNTPKATEQIATDHYHSITESE